MGKPNPPCFDRDPNYLRWTVATSSTTASPLDQDFFILPVSGVICPSIVFDAEDNTWVDSNVELDEKLQFVCISEKYDPNPCILEVGKYIRVADINIETNRCKRHRIRVKTLSFPTTTTTTTTTTTVPPITTTIPPTVTTLAPGSFCGVGSNLIMVWGDFSSGSYGSCNNNLQVNKNTNNMFSNYIYRWDNASSYAQNNFPTCVLSTQNTSERNGSAGEYFWVSVVYKEGSEWRAFTQVVWTVSIWVNGIFDLENSKANFTAWDETRCQIILDENNCPSQLILSNIPLEGIFPYVHETDPEGFNAIPGLQQNGTIILNIYWTQ
jgi:hypothetical protein